VVTRRGSNDEGEMEVEERKRGRSGDKRKGREEGYLLVLGLVVRGRAAIRPDTHRIRVDKAS